jgi:hypothetical protein
MATSILGGSQLISGTRGCFSLTKDEQYDILPETRYSGSFRIWYHEVTDMGFLKGTFFGHHIQNNRVDTFDSGRHQVIQTEDMQ